jgi:ATP-dependent Clp protease ATP-binding subunit ClpC
MEKGELPKLEKEGYEYINRLMESIPKKGTDYSKNNSKNASNKKRPLFVLKNGFGKDVTEEALEGELDPVIGRSKEIERAILILSRRTKNNPILIGEPGVGKTAIVEALAQKIVDGTVPEELKKKRIISLNIGNIIAGTKYRGEFEERMRKIIEDLAGDRDIVLFIDEFHTVIGAGGAEGAVDASNLLKPALARGQLQVMGATTLDEYRKYVEKDAALARRFQPIQVDEPTLIEAVEIVRGITSKLEEFHSVKISDEAVKASVELSVKYIPDRFLPDKAIDVLDESCAMKKLQVIEKPNELQNLERKQQEVFARKEKAILERSYEKAKKEQRKENAIKEKVSSLMMEFHKKETEKLSISKEDIATVVGKWTGIPVNQLSKEEKEKLKTLEQDLQKSVKGQEEAIKSISKAIRRNKIGLKDPKRPIFVGFLLGPTGVGKTELAKSVAKLIYGSEDNMKRFDMSEFMEKHSISKLIGSPPGYIGHEDEGELTKFLRHKPDSLVLFDEIEKAHPDVLNLFLQLYEDGRITDSKGRVIDAKNAIFLMTSNVGSEIYQTKKEQLGFGVNKDSQEKDIKENVLKVLKADPRFKPEFLNRIDDILVFNKLSREVLFEIAQKMVYEMIVQLKEKEIEIEVDEDYINHLVKDGYKPEHGARNLRREIEKAKDLIADKIIDEDVKEKMKVTVVENRVLISVLL